MKIKKILVPVDFSAGAEAAALYSISLAEQLQASVDILHVWEYPYFVGSEVMLYAPGQTAQSIVEYAKQRAQEEMKAFVQKLPKDKKIQINTHLEVGIVESKVLEEAKRLKSDLLVMGTHGRSGISKFVLGSVAEKVIRSAECPVLTIRQPESA